MDQCPVQFTYPMLSKMAITKIDRVKFCPHNSHFAVMFYSLFTLHTAHICYLPANDLSIYLFFSFLIVISIKKENKIKFTYSQFTLSQEYLFIKQKSGFWFRCQNASLSITKLKSRIFHTRVVAPVQCTIGKAFRQINVICLGCKFTAFHAIHTQNYYMYQIVLFT